MSDKTPLNWLLSTARGASPRKPYVEWLERAGIVGHLIGPGDRWDIHSFDAVLLTGGVDVNPKLYNEAAAPETKDINGGRDALEVELIAAFFNAKKPVFGVCRGIQILNVALGGRLIQHIPALVPATEEHRQMDDVDSFHAIRFTGASRLAEALRGAAEVNSAHHQAVHPGAVGVGLRVTAVSGEGIIEAVEGVDLPSAVLAVQWHPERLPPDHPASTSLLKLMLRR